MRYAPVFYLHLSILDGFISCKFHDKRDDYNFEIVNFPYLDEDVPPRVSYGVYISQLIRFARVFGPLTDFNTRNELLTVKFQVRVIGTINSTISFSKIYRLHFELFSKI